MPLMASTHILESPLVTLPSGARRIFQLKILDFPDVEPPPLLLSLFEQGEGTQGNGLMCHLLVWKSRSQNEYWYSSIFVCSYTVCCYNSPFSIMKSYFSPLLSASITLIRFEYSKKVYCYKPIHRTHVITAARVSAALFSSLSLVLPTLGSCGILNFFDRTN